MSHSSLAYRPEVDGLRALAVIPVILFHAGWSVFRGGFVGVDVFFVISGYLITGILLSDLRRGRFSIVDFYERRARRILPALFVVLLLCLPAMWWTLVPADAQEFSQSLGAVVLFVSNFFFWSKSGYFDTSTDLKPLLHTWSLAVEEQYYLFFPLLLWALRGVSHRRLLAVLGLLAACSLALAEWGRRVDLSGAFYLLPSRGWELLIGAGVSVWASSREPRDRRGLWYEFGALAGLAMLLLALARFGKSTPLPGLYGLCPTLGTGLLLLCAGPHNTVGRVLGHRWLVGIGLVSYSAYLWHQPLLAFARQASAGELSLLERGGLVALTFLLAYLSWRFVEAPFRRRDCFDRRRIFVLAAAVSAVLLCVAAAGHWTKGFERLRLDEARERALQTSVPSPYRDNCHTGGRTYKAPADACVYPAGELRWAVLGDSHTVELAYALGQRLAARHEALKHLSFSNCPPSLSRTDSGVDVSCAEWTREAVAWITASAAVRHVVVSYRIHAALFGEHEAVFPHLPDEFAGEERQRRWADYVGVVKALIAAGKDVTLVLQAPELPRTMARLVWSSAYQDGQVRGVDRSWWTQRSAFVMAHLADLPTRVRIIDPTGLFCDEKLCLAARGGQSYYFDDDHLSVVGADLVVQEVLKGR